jgi:hypothetical protein
MDDLSTESTAPESAERARQMLAGSIHSEESIVDAIADLLHLADASGMDADSVIAAALMHFGAER